MGTIQSVKICSFCWVFRILGIPFEPALSLSAASKRFSSCSWLNLVAKMSPDVRTQRSIPYLRKVTLSPLEIDLERFRGWYVRSFALGLGHCHLGDPSCIFQVLLGKSVWIPGGKIWDRHGWVKTNQRMYPDTALQNWLAFDGICKLRQR